MSNEIIYMLALTTICGIAVVWQRTFFVRLQRMRRKRERVAYMLWMAAQD
ncbi:MAG: hypothetical protein R3B84_22465 [Zavarzinella sp.]